MTPELLFMEREEGQFHWYCILHSSFTTGGQLLPYIYQPFIRFTFPFTDQGVSAEPYYEGLSPDPQLAENPLSMLLLTSFPRSGLIIVFGRHGYTCLEQSEI